MKVRWYSFMSGMAIAFLLLLHSASLGQHSSALSDGFYLVSVPGLESENLVAKSSDEKLVTYDRRFLDTNVTAYTKFLLSTSEYVRLRLKILPEPVKQPNDRQNVILPLIDEDGKHLFEFTKKHTGKMLAIVVGGQVVSVYTIKGAINGGVVQIGRCSRQATDFLLAVLQKNIQKSK